MQLKKIQIKSIRKLEQKKRTYDLSVLGNHNFFIGNSHILTHNCDALTPDAQRALRNMMEAFSATTRFVLTANYVERIIDPLVSRTQVFKLTPPSKKEVATRLVEILKAENVEYEKEGVVQLINAYFPDIRKVISAAQQATRDGKLVVSVETLIGQDMKLKVVETLMSDLSLKDKVNTIRKDVADEGLHDFVELYQILYTHVEDYAPDKVPQAVIAIAEGQWRDGQVPDKEINFMATLYNILS